MQESVVPTPAARAALRPRRMPSRISMKLFGPGTRQVARLTTNSEASETRWAVMPPQIAESCCQGLAATSVDDARVDDALQLAAEVEGAGRHQLGHEHR